jgi:molybdenum cofactor synthesis domain-containing protein
MYDMLKPVDKQVEIGSIKLQHKEGGKSDMQKQAETALNCAVIVCSDTISEGEGVDTAGKAAVEELTRYGIKTSTYEIIPDDITIIRSKVEEQCAANVDLLIFTGGTGLSARDVTPDAIAPLIEIPIPGIMEAFRHYGQERMPYAMLSRGVAGFIKNTLVITLPGSEKAVSEAMNALFPQLLHVFKIRSGYRHTQ